MSRRTLNLSTDETWALDSLLDAFLASEDTWEIVPHLKTIRAKLGRRDDAAPGGIAADEQTTLTGYQRQAVQQTPPSGHRWTSHGHACCDAEIADRPPVVVTVCGGPRNCSKCRNDARAAHAGTEVSR